MGGFFRFNDGRFSDAAMTMRRACTGVFALALAFGCDTTKRWPYEGPDSVRVTVRSPAQLGSAERRISDLDVVVDLDVVDAHGDPVADVVKLNVYAQWLGTLSPARDANPPLQEIEVRGGHAAGVHVNLPVAFGQTVLWFEDTGADRISSSFATGASLPLWYPDPTAADVNRPINEMAADSNEHSPLEGKQLNVVSQPGNQLVVTATYTQSYNVSEVRPDGTTPDYGHLYVFSFSKPPVYVGQVLEYVTGGVTEFNGMTELSFPRASALEPQPQTRFFPKPVIVSSETLKDRIAMEKLEGALIQVQDAVACPLNDYDQKNYDKFGQWIIDVGAGCTARFLRMSVVTKGAVGNIDQSSPTMPGQTVPPAAGTRYGCITGTLRNVALNQGSVLVWILYPRPDDAEHRRPSDVKPMGACQ